MSFDSNSFQTPSAIILARDRNNYRLTYIRRGPEREETSLCLDHVRNLLEAQITLVNNGKNKEVEKRFEYYAKHN
jgi:hypothetical protein